MSPNHAVLAAFSPAAAQFTHPPKVSDPNATNMIAVETQITPLYGGMLTWFGFQKPNGSFVYLFKLGFANLIVV
jgi:hypothetical protein